MLYFTHSQVETDTLNDVNWSK